MIYDCFLYYDEDMLLDIRLHTLADVVYRFVIAIVLQMGMPPNDLKLFTSVLVVIALALPMMRDKVQRRKVG